MVKQGCYCRFRPTPTPRSTTTREPAPIPGERGSSGDGPCDNDDEDCGSGSGFVEPVHTPTVLPDDIYLNTTPEPTKRDNDDGGLPEVFPIDEVKPPDSKTTTTDPMVITVNMTETPQKKSAKNIITTRRPTLRSDPPDTRSNSGQPDVRPNPKEDQVNQKPKGYGPLGLNIGLIVGIVAGILLLILLFGYALYKYKSRDEGSYKIDESKNYPYPDTASSKASSQVNGGVSKSGMQASKPKSKKDVKEWYV